MGLQKLIESSKKFKFDEVHWYAGGENARQSFLEKFPLNSLKDLSLDQYIQRTDKESFCYWLEYKKILFGIGGGNASKFGLHEAKDGNYYEGYGKNKRQLSGEELTIFFEKIKNEIITALSYVEKGQIDKIKDLDIPIWNMVLQKILSIYYPEKFIAMGSSEVLLEFAHDIELGGIELEPDNAIQISYECKKLLDSVEEFKDWDYWKLGVFIFEIYDIESKRDYYILGSKYGEHNTVDIFPDMFNKSAVAVGFSPNSSLEAYYGKNHSEITEFLKKQGEQSRSYSALKHFLSLKPGDRIAIKSSGSPKGGKGFLSIVGIAEVVEKEGVVYTYDPNGLHHLINVKFLKAPVYKEFELGGYGRTIQKISKREHIDLIFKSEYEVLASHNSLLDPSNKEEQILIKRLKKAGLDTALVFYDLSDKLIANIGISQNDERVTYNLPTENLVGITVGQRYCLLIKNTREGVLWGYIHDGNNDQKWWKDTLDADEVKTDEGKILKYSKQELSKTAKSGFRDHNSAVLERSLFDLAYREAIFKKAFSNYNSTPTIKDKHMEASLNQILYGPPGTGKTFTLKDKYFERYTSSETSLTAEKHLENVVQKASWWEVIAIALLELKKAKVSGIMEHPWVEKKVQLSNNRTVRQGLWGNLQAHTIESCEFVKYQKRTAPLIFNKTEDSYWEIVEEEVHEVAPELFDLLNSVKEFQPNPDIQIERYEFVTFHQSYGYEDFIEGIKPIMPDEGEEVGDLGYKIEEGVFKRLCDRADNDPENRYAIFIDEINRGNISQIFGELITLIEKDKRKGAAHELSAILPYSKKPFMVPSNLDIYGTMNTADRSVEALDTALRRRFSFVEMMPNPKLLAGKTIEGISLKELLKTINDRVELLVDRDHTIGHSYFINVETKAQLVEAFNDKIIPLLQEYFYGDFGKIGLVLGKGFVEVNNNNNTEFASFTYEEQDDFKTSTYSLLKATEETIIYSISLLLNTKSESSQD